ncbi:hypothetical protein [Dysgonomonas sp. ZJ279]|uniref:hypothetical protein n=1 Tax=Dysgonomonas sp. ZJ279 TaxID=2709796 RepID=UPI0013ECDB92|nr:hypothetical protein [Dysgonomonas sp. ZJ279]
MPNIKDRVIEIAEDKGVIKEEFFPKIGMTAGSFRGKAKETPLNSNAIENLLAFFQDVNAEWLVTGKGEKYKNSNVITGDNNVQTITSGIHGNQAQHVKGNIVYVADDKTRKIIKEDEIEIIRQNAVSVEAQRIIDDLTHKLSAAKREIELKDDLIMSLNKTIKSQDEIIASKDKFIDHLSK